METEIATELIRTGDKTFMWVGIALFAVQLIFIPCVVFLFNQFSNQSKKLTDAERLNTKHERDAQMAALEKKLDDHIMSDNHKYDELNRTIEGLGRAIDKQSVKVDKIYNKVYNIA